MRAVIAQELTLAEVAHLTDLVRQFGELVDRSAPATDPHDPAIARLVPAAYRDDTAATDEFRALTQGDLLDRRRADADTVSRSLLIGGQAVTPDDLEGADPRESVMLSFDLPTAEAWLRTLAALRLVLASRLGIASEDDHDPDDPCFGIYDWLGYRLEGLVRAVDDLDG